MSDAEAFREHFTSRMMSNLDGELDAEVKRLRTTVKSQAAEIHRLGKRYDRAIESRSEWRRQAESAERALAEEERKSNQLLIAANIYQDKLAEAIKVIGFYADEGNWCSPSKGFALQYDPELSAFQKDRGAAARDFITAQEKEKGK